MRRIGIVLALGLTLAPLAAEAQQTGKGKVYRISSIVTEAPTTPPGQGPFWDRMRELGWVYGQNVVSEERAFGADVERIPVIAKELTALGTDVFLTGNATAASRIQRETRTIPIVATTAGDLVLAGFKSDPVSLDVVWTTMTAAKEAGHEGQGAKADHDSWQ
jgi:hypothetical protein